MKIAIVGMGVSGISVLGEYANRQRDDLKIEIDVYDQPETFGTGLPYQLDSESLLLNQKADTMSLLIEEPLDFVNWVESHTSLTHVAEKHLPRLLYGRYLRKRLESFKAKQVCSIYAEYVEDVSVQDAGYVLKTHHEERNYDIVHLCIGHLPYLDPYHLKGQPRFIFHPYPVTKTLRGIPKRATVGIIGTGLTALDLVKYFQMEQKEVSVKVFSRSGKFPTVRGNEQSLELKYLTSEQLKKQRTQANGFLSLAEVVKGFKLECEYQGIHTADSFQKFGKGTKASLKKELEQLNELGSIQSVIHQMDEILPEIWNGLTNADKKSYKEKYEKKIDAYRSPLPKESVRELLKWWDEENVQVYGGIESVHPLEKGFNIELKSDEVIPVDYLVNATGQNTAVDKEEVLPILLKEMLNKRILQSELFGGVQVIWPTLSVVSQRYGVLETLKVHGQLISGVEYGNNTVGMIIRSSRRAVSHVIESSLLK